MSTILRLTILLTLGTAALGLRFGAADAVATSSAHVIRLTANRFTPEEVTVRAGDSLRFVNNPGGLHTIEFRKDVLTPAARKLLEEDMPGREVYSKLANPPLSSPMLTRDGEVYAFAVPALPPGRYEYFCEPHVGAGMKGVIIVAAQGMAP
jgi:plastocyanin